ncbi:MAG: hypothetical protein IPK34_03765 [Ramlibacter sp.]|nr:hypothetical protein [Ramlibacter sp.]
MFRFVLRLVLLAAGLVFAASLLLAVGVMLVLWGLRMLWARLTGRPVTPFVMRMDPRGGFNRFYAARSGAVVDAETVDRGASPAVRGRRADVTDVEARPVPPASGDQRGP